MGGFGRVELVGHIVSLMYMWLAVLIRVHVLLLQRYFLLSLCVTLITFTYVSLTTSPSSCSTPCPTPSGPTEEGPNKDVCSQVSQKEAHSGHSSAGAHLLREEDHVERTLSVYRKVG